MCMPVMDKLSHRILCGGVLGRETIYSAAFATPWLAFRKLHSLSNRNIATTSLASNYSKYRHQHCSHHCLWSTSEKRASLAFRPSRNEDLYEIQQWLISIVLFLSAPERFFVLSNYSPCQVARSQGIASCMDPACKQKNGEYGANTKTLVLGAFPGAKILPCYSSYFARMGCYLLALWKGADHAEDQSTTLESILSLPRLRG